MSTAARRRAFPLKPYLREIAATPLLTAEQERALAGRVVGGDPEARDHLARANLRLVVYLARGFLDRGLPLEDLVAEGNLGLMRAVEGYDGRDGVRFSTYAAYWVRQSIRAAVMKQGRPIRLPAYMVNLLIKWRRAGAALAERLGRDPTAEEVGRELQVGRKRLARAAEGLRALEVMAHPGAYLAEDEELVDGRARPAVDRAIEADEREQALGLLAGLDGREQSVLRLRFGLESGVPMTLKAVGAALGGYTRERVRQLECQALAKLRVATVGAS